MKSVIAIANQKGGVGKTTSAAALGITLSRQGQAVHLIDVDPQADLTATFGQHDDNGLLFEALSEQTELPVVQIENNLTLTPSSIELSRGESVFLGAHGREFLLQSSLAKTNLPDDCVVIIDAPPSLGVLTVNCLAAADKLIVALHPGGYEVKALILLQQTLSELQQRINPNIELMGVILTNTDGRKKITSLVEQQVSNSYQLLGAVPQDSRLMYATSESKLVDLQNSPALVAYDAIAKQINTLLWEKTKTQQTSAA